MHDGGIKGHDTLEVSHVIIHTWYHVLLLLEVRHSLLLVSVHRCHLKRSVESKGGPTIRQQQDNKIVTTEICGIPHIPVFVGGTLTDSNCQLDVTGALYDKKLM